MVRAPPCEALTQSPQPLLNPITVLYYTSPYGTTRVDRTHQPWAPCDPHAHQPWAPCDPHAHQPWAPCESLPGRDRRAATHRPYMCMNVHASMRAYMYSMPWQGSMRPSPIHVQHTMAGLHASMRACMYSMPWQGSMRSPTLHAHACMCGRACRATANCPCPRGGPTRFLPGTLVRPSARRGPRTNRRTPGVCSAASGAQGA